MTDDPFDLGRFEAAQAPVYAQACAELRAGRKRTHWMWFIFPQLRGLGHSAMAMRYGIGSRAEAEAYLRHAVLGTRLLECTALVNALPGRTAHEIFGSPDDMKLRSCLTLFANVAEFGSVFAEALRRYYDGPDEATLSLLPSPQAQPKNE